MDELIKYTLASHSKVTIANGYRQLNSHYVVRVWVGGLENPPFYIAEPLLENASQGLKEAASKATFKNGQHDLHLRDDDYEAWKVLFYWLITKNLPEEAIGIELLLVRSWALGEKYGITQFQDEAMLFLLLLCEGDDAKPETIEAAFRLLQPETAVRRLMAEELLSRLEAPMEEADCGRYYALENITPLAGVGAFDFVREMLLAKRTRANVGGIYYTRFKKRKGEQYGRWKSFMVGEGLSVHGRAAAEETGLEAEESDDETE